MHEIFGIILVLMAPFVGRGIAILAIRSALPDVEFPAPRNLGNLEIFRLVYGKHTKNESNRGPDKNLKLVRKAQLSGELITTAVTIICVLYLPTTIIYLGIILGYALIAISISDALSFRIPNILSYPLITLGLTTSLLLQPDESLNYVLGGLAGFCLFFAVRLIHKSLTGKLGLGLGDAKLLAAGGALTGLAHLFNIVLVASAVALASQLILSRGKIRVLSGKKIAFGPYLSLSIFVIWFFQNAELF